ncbi:TolB family protein [Aggregatilinea lenta]|uniref:TolB family protein n=1 Tax=Aggregatilinea lenta TaxID=913108 RepID=UPI000E5BCDE4|nr:PD40 domain-containing protein [Aggregatilinea lenta]
MSESGTNPQVNDLLEKGIKAARAGDNAAARQALEEVVKLDQYNEKGWFWLAAVVDTVEEKRVCLGNVIVINPNNRRAQNLLNRLDEEEIPQAATSQGSGPSRTTVYAAILLGALALVLLVVVLVVLLGGGDDESGAGPTAIAGQPSAQSANLGTEAAVEVTPSITPTRLPPTWTPVPSPTPRAVLTSTPLASIAASAGGTIILQSGQVVGDEENQPIWITSPDGGTQRQISPDNNRGHTPVLGPGSAEYAYIMFATGTREVVLIIDNMSGTNTRWATTLWGGVPILIQQNMPAWSSDGAWITFTAVGPGAIAPDLYRLSTLVTEPSPDALEQLTSDDAAESWPAFSPDTQSIVYAAEYVRGGQDVSELRVYNVADGFIRDLTTNGTDLVESAPDWSPDGQFIVFEGREAGSGQSSIYRTAANGSGEPEKLFDSGASDIRPRYSPNGQYIVFSSNRTGNWDVFIYEFATGTTYQVTSGQQTDIANDWSA